jgi:stage V sporulation protein R
MSLPDYLRRAQEAIKQHALDFGLEPFETVFELIGYEQMNEVAAFLGFPTRYPHWRFGMEYERLQKSYSWGLHKIYELVINNDPCYAYLLEGNSTVEQKMVMAHVYGHSDFFRNNAWFSHTPRNMINEMANHGTRISQYVDRHGQEPVEDFLDICLTLDNLIDYHSPFIRRRRPAGLGDEEPKTVRKMDSPRSYLDRYVNPPDFLEAQKQKLAAEEKQAERFPENPERDVMLFLIEHAPLKPWQRHILSIVREEAYYFAPQGQTKIMNEGWASFWHSRIMTSKVLTDAEFIDFADTHAGTVAMSHGSVNPYKIGIELFRDIEERWNKGRFGKDYEECDSIEEKSSWNRHLGLGMQKVFEVRKIYNDVSFIDAFLTPEFCWEHKLFTYEYNRKSGQFEIFSRDFKKIKEKLLFQLTNFGQPFIYVEDGNHANRGELLLWHEHHGIDLKKAYATDVLSNLQRIWNRPVHIRTVVEGKRRIWSHDGDQFREDSWNPQQ